MRHLRRVPAGPPGFCLGQVHGDMLNADRRRAHPAATFHAVRIVLPGIIARVGDLTGIIMGRGIMILGTMILVAVHRVMRAAMLVVR